MWQIFKIFWRTEGTRPLLVLTCLLLGGFAEAIGIGAMLPLLSTVLNEGTSAPSLIDKVTYQLLATLGLQPSLGILLVLILVIMTFRSIVLFATMTFAGVTGARVTINLRRKLVRALFDARWSFYARQSSGRIANSLGNDAQNAGNAYTLSATAATLFVQILAYAAVALAINWRVALCGLAAGLMIAAVSKRFVSLSRKAGYKQTDRVAVFASDTTGMLQNIKALKAMNRFESPIDNLAILLKKLKRTLYTQSVAKFALIYGNDLMIAIFVCVGTWLAFNFLKVPAAQLLVFGLLFFQVISYVTKFLKQLQSASLAEAGYTRTQQLIDETVAAEEVNTGSISPATGQGCRFEHVSFAHEDMPVVKDAHFNIPANKITVLEGPSGSGKTTLVDLLIGFHRADQGMIYVGENPIADIDIKQWRNKIGYVPQDLMLFHDNVRNNVTLYDTNITDEEIRNAADLAGVSGFLSALPSGLDTDVGELGGRLSGGQRQRIALARALVRKPELLILDEVTSALDPETESAIVDNISRLRGQFTIIVITHRPAWTNIADNLLKVEHGTVKQSKPTKRQKKS